MALDLIRREGFWRVISDEGDPGGFSSAGMRVVGSALVARCCRMGGGPPGPCALRGRAGKIEMLRVAKQSARL